MCIRDRRGSVVFEGVGLTYQGAGGASLAGLSFSVAPGETVGVIGGTGSGKSSLVNLIPRFYDATNGAVLVLPLLHISAAVGADERGDLPGFKSQADVLQHRAARIPGSDAVQFNHGKLPS